MSQILKFAWISSTASEGSVRFGHCLASASSVPVFGDGLKHVRATCEERGWFANAVRAAQAVDADFPRLTLHELRHTAASLAISAGANVKAVQAMLGHAPATMALDTYADLFDDDLEAVATRLEDARTRQSVGRLWGSAPQERSESI